MSQLQTWRCGLTVRGQALAGCLCGLVFWFGVLGSPAFAQCTYPAGATSGCTIWPSSATPSVLADSDAVPVELGLKFRTDVTGQVAGVRFYKSTTNTGTHVGHLWTSTGTLLASVTFSGETSSGWQQATFATPVSINANTTYVVSYYAPNGRYSSTNSYFAGAGVDSAPLHALANGVDGANGVYVYATGGGFPSSTWQSTNYWVDVVFTPTASDTTPPTVTAVSPTNGSTGVSITTTVTATFSEAIGLTTINTSTFQLLDPSSSAVAASVSYNSATQTAVLTPTLALATATTYTAIVRGGTLDPRVKDLAGNALAANYTWTFTTSATPPSSSCPCSIWSSTAVPTTPDYGPNNPVEVGVKFRSDVNGYITGLRFYKSAANTGTHVANLWSSTGTLLATATFGSETASGWQQVDLSTPVAVAANTTYVASYHTTVGHHAMDQNYFASTGVNNAPLHALADGADGANGVYAYGATSSFPSTGYNSTNFWVDVVFNTSATDTTPPTVTAVSPASGASSVNVAAQVTATFSEPIDASTITTTTFLLKGPSGSQVSASVSYSGGSLTATLTPTAALDPSTTYTVTLVGGSTNPRIKDLAGNALAANVSWSFTTGGPPPSQGPGGPILVIASAANPFSRYYAEILRAEGLNAFTVLDIANVSAAVLSSYDVAILGNVTLTSAQVSMFSSWVNAGGNLIAMRPDKQLASLLGLTDSSTTLSNAYLLINTASGPGLGLVNQTIQFHGVADRYSLNGASSLATLYSSATAATTAPAVTLRSVGTGRAAAFTFDLAQSVVYTRQGNPAWSGQERDGQPPIRSDDLFYGGTSADWVDLNKVAIPQADEQQRLLANLILQMNQAKKPLPRFWYLPRGLKAAVVMTGDDHGYGGTAGRFDTYIADSPQGCSVDNWTCVRSTSYLAPGPLTNAQAVSYAAQGFEIGLHVDTGCSDFTPSSLDSTYTDQLAAWTSVYTGLLPPSTERTHCIPWSDYDTQPQVELTHGIRLDTNYYYWPPTWVNNRPGFFTGSGMPMRFATRNGDLIDVYQATTQMTDESEQTYPFTINTLLDNAVGSPGYYGVFTANMHTDYNPSAGSDAIVASAQARGVPIVSALQMLRWLDGRNGSSFGSLAWNGNVLSFSVAVAAGANGLQVMLPVSGPTGSLSAVTLNGTSVAYTTSVVKGIQYAVFSAAAGSYQASYSGGGGGAPMVSLAPTSLTFASQQVGTTSAAQAVVLTNTGNATLTISGITITGTNAGDFAQTNNCGTSVNAGANCTINVTFTPTVAGTRTGTVTIADNAAGSPQAVGLTGTGTGTPPTVTWYAGDMHVHRSCGGSPEAVSSLYNKMGTNSLAFISLLADMGNGEVQNPTTDLPLVNGADDPVSTTGRIVHWDAEWHWDATYNQYAHQALGGHVVALGLTQASQLWYEYTYPIFNWAHQQGGIAGFVHMQYLDGTGIPDTLTCCSPIEYPVEVALGSADFIEEDVNGSDVAVEEWYRLLNAGFRPGFAAGTDYPCNGGADLGGLLTYVQVPAGQMTYRNWVNGIADGRTVVSRNGQNEFLQLTVNSTAGPGDEIQLAASGSVPVSIQWTAKQSLSGTIELVKNGTVVTSWNASASATTPANVNTTVDFPKSGWLAARRMDSNGHVLHTGAVFVTVAGAPVRASVADAQYYVQWIDTLLARTSSGGVWSSYFTASGRTAAQARYSSARAIYQQIANEAGGASVQLSPGALTFGNQAVGTTSAAQAITLTNTGSAALTISSIGFTGTNPGDYAQTNTCPVSPSTLAAAGSCTINVTFKPTATGSRTATLSVADSASGSPHTAALSGTGGAAAVSLSPASLVFGNQVVNTTSAAQAITLTNSGTAPLTISSIGFTGTNPGDYAQTNTCPVSPSTLAAAGSCTINVTFRPTATGSRPATLTVTDNATGSPHTAGLSGTGVAPVVSLSPTSLAFGNQSLNTTSAAQAITLTNNGSGVLTISSITIAGANAGDYAQTNTCPMNPSTLATSGSCTINVTFRPTATGSRTATLTVTDNASGSPHTAGLTGTGVAPVVSLSPTSLSFGSQAVNTTSAVRAVTLTNTGNAPLTITTVAITGTNAGEYAQTNDCPVTPLTLAAAGTCTINVTFTPAATGTRTATLTVTDNAAGSPHTASLTGTGGAAAVTVSPTSLTFAIRVIGTTSSSSRVTLTNTGSAALTISSIAITGANAADFAETTTCGASLAAGSSCRINVTFRPTGVGPRSASLVITDSDPSSPQTVSLNGTGSAVSVSPTSLSFSRQTVGTTSAARTITVRNAGSAPLTMGPITITGTNASDYAQTNACGASLAAGASCTISVTFKPTATGTRTATVSISNVDPASPQTVTLTGTGR